MFASDLTGFPQVQEYSLRSVDTMARRIRRSNQSEQSGVLEGALANTDDPDTHFEDLRSFNARLSAGCSGGNANLGGGDIRTFGDTVVCVLGEV
jgi:hypothetical protein